MNVCILIVDDDRLVVDKIVEGIDWEHLGIAPVLTAQNIRQAKDILEEAPVDILLSDIEMPQGSGLELLEWIRDRKMQLDCIFLSSYAHFAYAQKAINLKSSEYLLKPASNREIEHALTSVVEETRKRKSGKEEDREKVLFWEQYLLAEVLDDISLEKAQSAGFYEPERLVCLQLMRVCSESLERHRKEITLRFLIQRVTGEFLLRNDKSGGELLTLVRYSDCEWFLLFSAEKENWPTPEWADAYQSYMEEALSEQICLYVGDVCRQRELEERCRCLEHMGREAVPGRTGVLFESEWIKKDVKYVEPPWREWEQEMLDTERIEGTKEKILDFLYVLWENNQVTVSVLERFRKELMQTIYWYFNRQDLLITRIFDGREFDDAYEKSVRSLSDMETFIHLIYGKLAGFCHQDNKQESVVNQMRQYIQEHLKEDLSRKTLAGVVFLSEDYISKIFMNVTGMSIPSYVASCRVKRAQEYLQYSNLSVSQIALEVGYTNFSYFSKTFRDYTGWTPNEYRSRVQSKE